MKELIIMLNIESLLLHFLIVLVPILIFYMQENELSYSSLNVDYIFFILISVCSIILQYYPLIEFGSLFFGFSSLLIMFTLLYGYKKIGIMIIILTVFYRMYIFFPNIEIVRYVIPFIYVIPLFFHKYWMTLAKKRKYYFSFFLSFIMFVVFMIFIWGYRVLSLGLDSEIIREELVWIIITGLLYCLSFFLMIYIAEFLKETRLLKEMTQDTEKMILVSELAAGVAHEVRNPLTVIKGFVQLVEKDLKDKNKEYMQLVLTELDRAEKIITDYLQLAKRYHVEKTIIPVSDMLKNVNAVMHSFTNINGVSLQLEIGEEMSIFGDLNKMKQVLYNIIKNATEAIQRVDGLITIRSYRYDKMVIIEIQDNGIGMNQQELMRIGEPFYTNKVTGTGLGIMVTKAIIAEHGGALHYRSEVNEGTTVTIQLPLYEDRKETDADFSKNVLNFNKK